MPPGLNNPCIYRRFVYNSCMSWTNYAVQVNDGEQDLPRKIVHQEFHHDALRVYCEYFEIEIPRWHHKPNHLFEGEAYIIELQESPYEDYELGG